MWQRIQVVTNVKILTLWSLVRVEFSPFPFFSVSLSLLIAQFNFWFVFVGISFACQKLKSREKKRHHRHHHRRVSVQIACAFSFWLEYFAVVIQNQIGMGELQLLFAHYEHKKNSFGNRMELFHLATCFINKLFFCVCSLYFFARDFNKNTVTFQATTVQHGDGIMNHGLLLSDLKKSALYKIKLRRILK